MKTKTLFIALIAIMFFAVQGYAQRRDDRGGSSRGGARVEQRHSSGNSRASMSRGSSYTRQPASSSRGSSYQRDASPSRQSRPSVSTTNRSNGTRVSTPSSQSRPSVSTPDRSTRTEPRTTQRDNRGSSVQNRNTRTYPNRSVAPAPQHQRHNPLHTPHHNNHGNWRPTFHHHHNYHHHHHRCVFDNWYWYSWGGYHNRFICHRHYHDRFFDSMLGYYLWGAFDAPTRLDIGNMTFTRYNSTLKIKIGYDYSYFDLYRYQKLRYQIGYTFVEVTINYGYATIYFYDEYGNSATYQL